MSKGKSKKEIILVLLLLCLLAFIGTSYAFWKLTYRQTTTNTITTGCFKLEFQRKSN